MINTDHLSPAAETLARELATHDDYRVLRRVPTPFPSMPHMGPVPDGKCVAIVDTETTGLSAEYDVIIELAIMLCFVDDDEQVIGHFGPFSWLQDPEREIDPKVSLITGLGAQHLKGKKINDAFVRGLLDRAALILAHNARFDAGFIERRYPDLAGKAWACSCNEIDWLKLGFEGRSQSALLAHAGWFSDAHRAAADVWALFWLLRHRQREPGGGMVRTHLSRLIEAADTPTVMVQAERAPYSKKDMLKARGYQWNPEGPFWQIELPRERAEHEQGWGYRNGLPAMTTRTVTAHERHR